MADNSYNFQAIASKETPSLYANIQTMKQKFEELKNDSEFIPDSLPFPEIVISEKYYPSVAAYDNELNKVVIGKSCISKFGENNATAIIAHEVGHYIQQKSGKPIEQEHISNLLARRADECSADNIANLLGSDMKSALIKASKKERSQSMLSDIIDFVISPHPDIEDRISLFEKHGHGLPITTQFNSDCTIKR